MNLFKIQIKKAIGVEFCLFAATAAAATATAAAGRRRRGEIVRVSHGMSHYSQQGLNERELGQLRVVCVIRECEDRT